MARYKSTSVEFEDGQIAEYDKSNSIFIDDNCLCIHSGDGDEYIYPLTTIKGIHRRHQDED